MKQRPPRQPFTEFTHRCRQAQPWLKLYTKGEIVFYLKWRRKKSKLCHLVLLPTTAGPQPDRSPTDTWFVENLASIQLTSDSVSVNCGDIVLGNIIRRQWDKLEMNSGKIDSDLNIYTASCIWINQKVHQQTMYSSYSVGCGYVPAELG